jgi:phage terminase large subunit-like protein
MAVTRRRAFGKTPHTDAARAWADRAATDPGECRLVRLAAQRFVTDYEAALRGDGLWAFQPELAEGAMVFASALPNIKGPEANKPLRLMDWQRFVYANIFGFTERERDVRRFRQGTVWVPRGNGKTTVAAPVLLAMTFIEEEGGAEGYAAAVTRDQARILFDMSLQMTKRAPRFQQYAGVGVSANAIYQERTASRLIPISSDAKALDGLNVQVAVCDEIGSHRTSQVYDVLLTALAKRLQPFLLSISTATGNNSGVGKQVWDYGVRILDSINDDDRFFALIYTPDEGDDIWDETVWRKVNPGWGQTVQPDPFRSTAKQARNNAAQEAAFKTRHLNIWVGADDALFSPAAWSKCRDAGLSLEQLAGAECHLGLDLASKTDLAAIGIVFPLPGDDDKRQYACFAQSFINRAAVTEQRNASYAGWEQAGQLIVTDGNETDFGAIEAAVCDLCSRFNVLSVGVDPWNAAQMKQRLMAHGVPVVDMRPTMANMSEATKEFDAAMRAQRLRHNGDSVLAWCVGNCVGQYDVVRNVRPNKPSHRLDAKIDAAVAVIMALSRIVNTPDATSVYETRGLLVIG